MGTCTGFGSSCNTVGVALETRCHLGQTVKYDTVTQLGWSANIIHHGIAALIDVLARQDIDWAGSGMKGSVPAAAPETDCVVSACMRVDRVGLEILMGLYNRIVLIGRSATLRTLLARVLWAVAVGCSDFRTEFPGVCAHRREPS